MRPSAARALPARPGVAAAPAHARHRAHDLDGKIGDVIVEEHEAHLRSVVWPKMSTARVEMSRPNRAPQPRALAAASAGLAPTRRLGATRARDGAGTGVPRASRCTAPLPSVSRAANILPSPWMLTRTDPDHRGAGDLATLGGAASLMPDGVEPSEQARADARRRRLLKVKPDRPGVRHRGQTEPPWSMQ